MTGGVDLLGPASQSHIVLLLGTRTGPPRWVDQWGKSSASLECHVGTEISPKKRFQFSIHVPNAE
jgi:hypothetical protein